MNQPEDVDINEILFRTPSTNFEHDQQERPS